VAHLGDWTDSDSDPGTLDPTLDIGRRIRKLEEKLKATRKEFIDYRASVRQSALRAFDDPNASTPLVPPARDDDTHYFQSYDEKGLIGFPSFHGCVN
jgi:protein arginine N-methyltransferase 3